MRSGSCGLVQRIGTVDSATPHPDPSGGQAPALHFLIPPSAIGLQFGTFRRWRAGIEVDWRAHFRTIDEFGGGNHSFSYQSLMPAGAGTRRYEKPELRFGMASWRGGFCYAPPRPLRGTSPRATGFRHLPERRGPSGQPRLTGTRGTIHPGSESGTCFRTDAEDDTFSIDCVGGRERLGEASGYDLPWKLFCVGSHRDASISSAGGRPSGVTGGSCSTTT